MTYSMEFRRAVAAAYEGCGSSEEVAEQFGCSESWVRRLLQRQRETGSLAPRPPRRPNNFKLDARDLEQLRALITQTPDMTLGELAAALEKKVSIPTIHRDETTSPVFKKKSLHASEQDRPDVQEKRAAWFEQFRDVALDQLVFIDEFGATTQMTRARARGPRGTRVICKNPHGHWKTLSTIAALNVTGILTCCCFEGGTDLPMFVGFVREFLLPKLKAGQVVILDNLGAHCSPRVDALIESAGARVLRLPPYSPDYNPIEMAISKMKGVLRTLAKRDVPSLYKGLAKAVRSITPADARHFIKHCKYAMNE